MTLYNLHNHGSGLVITKFTDHGSVESSYALTEVTCECPAGQRPTCRHRQMLPALLPIANTHWFYDYERAEIVDISGVAKTTIDRLTSQPYGRSPIMNAIPSQKHENLERNAILDDAPLVEVIDLPRSAWRRI